MNLFWFLVKTEWTGPAAEALVAVRSICASGPLTLSRVVAILLREPLFSRLSRDASSCVCGCVCGCCSGGEGEGEAEAEAEGGRVSEPDKELFLLLASLQLEVLSSSDNCIPGD